MNILIVSDAYPAYDRSSYELRFSRLAHVLAQTHQLTICPQDVPYMVNELGVEAVNRYREALQIDGIAIQEQGLVNALRSCPYELILFVIHTQASPQNLRQVRHWAPSAKIVIDSVDVQFGRYLSRAELTGAKEDFEQASLIKAQELAAFNAVDMVITVSEPERQMVLRELPDKPVTIIPNIHPLEESIPTAARDGRSMVFVGWGKYDPNADAVLYFAREILPLVLAKIPHAIFKVIGGGYPEEVLQLNGGAIEILGFVPETALYLKESHISIAPLRYGSGVKGKIGEALSHGMPVVTTSVGLEGFGLTPGINVLAADTPAEFANHVVNLLTNQQLHIQISLAGWEFLRDSFSEQAVRSRIQSVFEEIEHLPQSWLVIQGRKLRSFVSKQVERHITWRLRRSRAKAT